MNQSVPLLNTGIIYVPLPTTASLNVVVVASVINALAPMPADTALGNDVAVVTIVLIGPYAVTVPKVSTLIVQVPFQRVLVVAVVIRDDNVPILLKAVVDDVASADILLKAVVDDVANADIVDCDGENVLLSDCKSP